MTTRYAPGNWYTLVADAVVMTIAPEAKPELIEQMWLSLANGSDLGDVLKVLAVDADYSFDRMPSFALARSEADLVRVAVRGPAAVRVTTGSGTHTLSGDRLTTWCEAALADAERVEFALGTADAPDVRSLAVERGIVMSGMVEFLPIGGLRGPAQGGRQADFSFSASSSASTDMPTFTSTEAERPAQQYAPPAPTAPAPTPAPAGRAPAYAGAEASPATAPVTDSRMAHTDVHAPISEMAGAPEPVSVIGRLCTVGHPNPPQVTQCVWCGSPMQGDPQPMERPPLGQIAISTGEVIPLQRPLVIGRRPQVVRGPGEEQPMLVTVPSQMNDISRNHLGIQLSEWSVLVTDLETTNGTMLHRAGHAPERLTPGVPYVATNGDVFDIGDGITIRFDILS